jgi:anti-sigma factor RsiW
MTHTEAVSNLASERYLLDEMTETERDAFETHYFECAECADDVKAGAIMREGIEAGFVSAPQVARIATFPPTQKRTVIPSPDVVRQAWYRSTALPWAVAATLAVMVGYQSQSPAPGEDGTFPEAVTPVTLRPASRGAVPTVSVAASHAALALDLDVAGATEVTYELRSQRNEIVTSGRAAAPAPGSPFLLVIPTFTLKPQQQYILSVRDASDPQRGLSDYHFATAP